MAKAGTVTTMEVFVQELTTADWAPNFNVLVPWVEPKLLPLIVRADPTGPDPAEKFVMLGGGITVKLTPELVLLPTVTVTLPVSRPAGHGDRDRRITPVRHSSRLIVIEGYGAATLTSSKTGSA